MDFYERRSYASTVESYNENNIDPRFSINRRIFVL